MITCYRFNENFTDIIFKHVFEMRIDVFFIKFRWNIFLVIRLTIFNITGSVNCLVLNRPQDISWTTELIVIDFTDENRLLGLND